MTNKEANESQQQPYDCALKSLLEDHAAEMIAELVPQSRLIEERNAELTRLNLRADIVYLIEYKGKHCSDAPTSHCGDGTSLYRRTLEASSQTLSDDLTAVKNVVVRPGQADCGGQNAIIR